MPDLSWGSMIDLTDAGVESSNRPETGCHRNVTHMQIRLVDELLRKMQLARLRDSTWCCAQVLEKQATKVA